MTEMTEATHDLFEIRTMSRHLRHGDYEAFRQALGSASYSFLPHFELLEAEQWEAFLMRWIEIGNIENPADEVEALVMSRLADGLMEQSAYDAAWMVLGLLRDSSKAKKKRAKCFEALMADPDGDDPLELYHERCIRFFEAHPNIEGGALCAARHRYALDEKLPEGEETWPIFEAIRVLEPCFNHPTCSAKCMRDTCEKKIHALAGDNSRLAREIRLKYAFGIEDWPAAWQLAKDLARYEPCDSSFAWLTWLLEGLAGGAQQDEFAAMDVWSEFNWVTSHDFGMRIETITADCQTFGDGEQVALPTTRAIRAALTEDWENVLLLVDALPEPWSTHFVAYALRIEASEGQFKENLIDTGTYLAQLKEAMRKCPCATFDVYMAGTTNAEIGDRLEAFERLLYDHDGHIHDLLNPSVIRELYAKMPEAGKAKAKCIIDHCLLLKNEDKDDGNGASAENGAANLPQPKPAPASSALKQTFIVALIIAAILGMVYYFMR